jgi:hypothetical protein
MKTRDLNEIYDFLHSPLVQTFAKQPRDYVMSVHGITGHAQSEEIEVYSFRVRLIDNVAGPQ